MVTMVHENAAKRHFAICSNPNACCWVLMQKPCQSVLRCDIAFPSPGLFYLRIFTVCICHAVNCITYIYVFRQILADLRYFDWLFPVEFPASETLKWWRPFAEPVEIWNSFFPPPGPSVHTWYLSPSTGEKCFYRTQVSWSDLCVWSL